jgi:hypothetical protein
MDTIVDFGWHNLQLEPFLQMVGLQLSSKVQMAVELILDALYIAERMVLL